MIFTNTHRTHTRICPSHRAHCFITQTAACLARGVRDDVQASARGSVQVFSGLTRIFARRDTIWRAHAPRRRRRADWEKAPRFEHTRDTRRFLSSDFRCGGGLGGIVYFNVGSNETETYTPGSGPSTGKVNTTTVREPDRTLEEGLARNFGGWFSEGFLRGSPQLGLGEAPQPQMSDN